MRQCIWCLSSVLFLFITSCQNSHPHKIKDHLCDCASYKIGSAIIPKVFHQDSAYRKVALEEFNSYTCENCMKFSEVSHAMDVYDWTTADDFVKLARDGGKRIHGHTLIWSTQLPDWVRRYSGTQAQWDTLMKRHIHAEVGRYRGKIASWDVVNEAFKDSGTVLDSTIWLAHIGTDYIGKAFQYAAEADPGALFFYNENNMEFIPGKVDSVLSFCDALRARGIRIDGVGIQMHIARMHIDTVRIREAMRKIAAHDYLVHVSELDYSANFMGDNCISTFSPALMERQERVYRFVSEAYSSIVPHRLQYGITVWGFDDKNSWIPIITHHPDWPCLYDSAYERKPAYYGFRQGLK